MNNTIKAILWVILGIFAIALGSVLIEQGAEIVAGIGNHIQRLAQIGDIRPSHKGFSAFVELLLIAIFVGWAIKRFIKKGR